MPDSQGVVLTNHANRVEGKHIHNYSTFDDSLSYRKYMTLRFGEYTPSFEMEGVPTDEISLNSHDLIDSLSLKAPFKGTIRKIKESFMVPNMAILPLNWDKIYAQPAVGGDVDSDANCVIKRFPEKAASVFGNLLSTLITNSPSASSSKADNLAWLTALVRVFVLGEYIYSCGSLLNVCGYKANAQIRKIFSSGSHSQSYDAWFDEVLTKAFSPYCGYLKVGVPDGNNTLVYYSVEGISSATPDVGLYYHRISFRHMIELFRSDPRCSIEDYTLTGGTTDSQYGAYLGTLSTTYPDSNNPLLSQPIFTLPISADPDTLTDMSQNNLNLSRLLAYQLIVYHFYTNSSVDFMYSADLYRQYFESIFVRVYPNEDVSDFLNMFMWNGRPIPFDSLSGRRLTYLLFIDGTNQYLNPSYATLSASLNATSAFQYRMVAFAAVFGFRKSLRYGDYFVGARPRPLAPINTDVSVNSNLVSVVDITRSIQAQRFANSVMRSRSKIEEYVKSLFGGSAPAPDYHNPFFLSRETEVIYGDEVQNTGASQIGSTALANSRTANFASNTGRFTFTFHNDDKHPCIYMQIISFDIKRAYTRSVDRQFFHLDRYDMFNPDFQYIGDQSVYGLELGIPAHNANYIPSVFAYQTRDEEYKQRFDVASGGFVENLPGWILTDDNLSRFDFPNISPSFIRSFNTELDQFFLSLTGFSLGSYFHFICITDNKVSAKRPMAVDPQILA